MKTVLDAHGAARRRLVQAAGAAALVPQAVLAAAPAGLQMPALALGTSLHLPSPAPVRVSGRVVDAAGIALAGRQVVLLDAQGRVAAEDRCDADGRFLLAAAHVEGRFSVDLDGARGGCSARSTVLTDDDGILRCAVLMQTGSA